MKKTASQIADYVITKCAELSEQDKANLEYINATVDEPYGWKPYAQLGGLGAGTGTVAGLGGAALGTAAGGGTLKGNLKQILRSGGMGGLALGAGGLGMAGLLHLLTEQNRPKMREQREEILSRAPEGYEG